MEVFTQGRFYYLVLFFIEGNLVGMASRQARIGVGHAIDQ